MSVTCRTGSLPQHLISPRIKVGLVLRDLQLSVWFFVQPLIITLVSANVFRNSVPIIVFRKQILSIKIIMIHIRHSSYFIQTNILQQSYIMVPNSLRYIYQVSYINCLCLYPHVILKLEIRIYVCNQFKCICIAARKHKNAK